MKSAVNKVLVAGVFASVLTVAIGATASAHVTVKPAEVLTAGFQTFTVSVPNENDISTTRVKVNMPEGLKYVQPTQKSGWDIDIESEGEGESATIKSITWKGSEVKKGFRDEFTFSAQVPEKDTELHWKAYQTYSDGTVVSWDKESSGEGHDSEDENSGPFSVTKVVAETADDASAKKSEQAAADAKNTANTALYVGVAGIVVGLIGVFLASRKK